VVVEFCAPDEMVRKICASGPVP